MDEKELKDREEKLRKIEKDLEKRAKEIEKKEQLLKKRTKSLDVISTSESFRKMLELLDEIYTMFVALNGTDEGLLKAIELIVEARGKYSGQTKEQTEEPME